jgi:RND superfamily putative drug exporter
VALARWGAHTAVHPWRVVLGWVILTIAAFTVAAAGVGGPSLFSKLSTGEPTAPGEAMTGRELLAAAEPDRPSILLTVDGVDVNAPLVAGAGVSTAAEVAAIDGVADTVSPFVFPAGAADPRAAAFVASGGPAPPAFLMVTHLRSDLTSDQREAAEQAVRAAYTRVGSTLPGARIAIGSGSALGDEIIGQMEADLRLGEGIALPLSFALMVVVFGGFVAAGMPIIGAIVSIGGALAALYGFSTVMDLDASTVNVVTLLGLALSIDYGLLFVSRCREELRVLAGGRPASDLTREEICLAVGRTTATAGRTVLFSGVTVAISLAGLVVFRSPTIRAIGAAGVSVVVVAMLVGVSMMPALCALGARRLLARGTETAPDDGVFSRLAAGVHRRPWVVMIATSAVLLALAVPALSMRLTSSGIELVPVGSPQRDFFERIDRDFPALRGPTATVVVQGSPEQARVWAQGTVTGLPGVTGAQVRDLGNGYAAVAVNSDDRPLGESARALAQTLREHRPDIPTWVTGQAAALVDLTGSIAQGAPYAGLLVVCATFVLLFLMTGSVVIPVKALLLNVISLGASLGVLTWVFQDGHLASWLGFTPVGAIESIIPPLAVAFGFGLSMDYELFLISRIAELHERGVENNRAVELGLQRSGRIITSAAALVVVVFAGFIAGKMLIIKEIGVALTVAVLLDASLVRMLLVPATMELLGEWNWWAPARLRRWHRRHGIRE